MSIDATLHSLAAGLRRADAALAARAGMDADTFALYRELLLSNLETGLAACYPQCKRLLGPDWSVLVGDFLAEGEIPSPAFHECPEAFLRYLLNRGKEPPWLAALAHWEWEELALSLAPWEPEPYGGAFRSWQDRPLLAPVHCLRSYPYAVHRVAQQEGPPSPETVYLLRYRDRGGLVRHWQLDPAQARLLAAMSEGADTVAAAVRQAFPDSPLDEDLRERMAAFFTALLESEALLGFCTQTQA